MKDQIQFETNGVTVLAVKMPNDAIRIHLKPHPINPDGLWLWYKVNTNTTGTPLPKGDWSIHAVTTELTEEEAKVLVYTDSVPYGDITHYIFVDYLNENYECTSAIESIHSLLRSHGIDPNEKYVLLIRKP